MLIGCIADDLTGATDLGVTLAREGLSVTQVNGVPDASLAIEPCDAVVVALKSRTNPPEEAVAWSLASLRWLRAHGAAQIYFKYCSTFDSTPRGNIGPVADALLDALGTQFTVATPAYPRNGRTVYYGNLFVGEVPLAESGMKDHPLTPMRDSNLVRVLGAQTARKVGLVASPMMSGGAAAIHEAMEKLQREGHAYAILDATGDEQLVAAGQACVGMPLVTGGAGLAMGLARARAAGRAAAAPTLPRIDGATAILSGSCSRATLAQVEVAKAKFPSYMLDPSRLDPEAALAWAKPRLASGPVLIYASAPPERVQKGREADVEAAFRRIAQGLAQAGVRRFVVAGGETSGAVVEALGVRALSIGPEIDPGVPWTVAAGEPRRLLALKSGNFGAPDFFAKAVGMLR